MLKPSPAATVDDVDTLVVRDDSSLQDAPCDLCAGALHIVDAGTGESAPCPSCFVASASATREIIVQTPEMVGRTVVGELAAAAEDKDSLPSPLACLSRWIIDYLDAEHVLRVLQIGLFSGAMTSDDHDVALARACAAEATLRRALGLVEAGQISSLEVEIERERMDPLDAVARLPGVDLTSHPALCDALISYGIRRRSQEASSPPVERIGSRILGSIGRAWGRLRRSWEP